jgi:hypothetical protein
MQTFKTVFLIHKPVTYHVFLQRPEIFLCSKASSLQDFHKFAFETPPFFSDTRYIGCGQIYMPRVHVNSPPLLHVSYHARVRRSVDWSQILLKIPAHLNVAKTTSKEAPRSAAADDQEVVYRMF